MPELTILVIHFLTCLLIPAYIPYPKGINVLAGLFEIAFSLLLVIYKGRQLAWGIVLMLIAFLPVHISMVSEAY